MAAAKKSRWQITNQWYGFQSRVLNGRCLIAAHTRLVPESASAITKGGRLIASNAHIENRNEVWTCSMRLSYAIVNDYPFGKGTRLDVD